MKATDEKRRIPILNLVVKINESGSGSVPKCHESTKLKNNISTVVVLKDIAVIKTSSSDLKTFLSDLECVHLGALVATQDFKGRW